MQLSHNQMDILNVMFKNPNHAENLKAILDNTKGSGELFLNKLEAYTEMVAKFAPETSLDDLDNLIFDGIEIKVDRLLRSKVNR